MVVQILLTFAIIISQNFVSRPHIFYIVSSESSNFPLQVMIFNPFSLAIQEYDHHKIYW